MPFTFSHPAAVLPLRILPRHWFSFTGLIAGSVAPDFECFLRMNADGTFSHTVAGIFLFGLPVGIVIAFIFYNIIVGPLLDNTPSILSCRLSFLKNSDWNNYFRNNKLKVCVCIIAGAISHVTWDNFTHEHGHFSQMVPWAIGKHYLLGIEITSHHMLQHISTLTGGLIIAVYIWFLPVDANHQPVISLKYWSIVAVLFAVIFSFRLSFGLCSNWLNNIAVSGIAAGMIAITSTSLLFLKRF